VGFILLVPVVFYFGELFGGVFGTEGKMALGVVWLSLCRRRGTLAIAIDMKRRGAFSQTFSIQSPSNMMQLGVPIRILPYLSAPLYHLIHESLLRRLVGRKRSQ